MDISLPVAHDDVDSGPRRAVPWTGMKVGPPSPDHDHVIPILEPTRDGFAARWARQGEGRHPAWPVATSYTAAWAALSAVLVAVGLLLTKVVLAGSRGNWDESANRWLADHRTAALDRVTSWATFLANTLPVLVLLAAVCLALLVMRRRREAFFLLGALTLEVTVFLTVNFLVDRPRPNVPRLDSTPSTGSYPSGHIAATLALWCGTALVVSGIVRNRLVRIACWVIAIAMTVAVGFARTYRGMHHVTDVLCGAALGIGALAGSVFAARVVTAAVDGRAEAEPACAASTRSAVAS